MIGRARRPGPLIVISLAYLTLVSGLMIWRGVSVSPDYLLLLLVPVAVLAGRFWRFLSDWVPFIAVFLAWEAMRGIAAKTGFTPHVGDLAGIETTLFGGNMPTAVLQGSLHTSPIGLALDYLASGVYFMHFAVPLAVGLILWLRSRTLFLQFTTALMGMSLVAFFFFLLVPSAPPWYAHNVGAVSGIHKILSDTLPSSVSPLYASLNPNPVAAMPSLHAAFPFLGFLALRQTFPRAAWFAFGWCVLVWFSIVYLGEHYVIDAVAGVALAGASWLLVTRVLVPRFAALRAAARRRVATPVAVGRPLPEESLVA